MNYIDLFKLEFENLIEEDVDSAIEYCLEAFKTSEDINIYLYLAEALMANDNFVEALDYICVAINGNCKDKILAYSLKGECLFYLDKYAESRLAFTEVLDRDELSFFASVYIIDIDIHEKKYFDAINIIDKVVYGNRLTMEDMAFLNTKKGWILLKYLDKQEEALELFNEAIIEDYNCGTAYVGMGYYFLAKEEYENAVIKFNRALELGEDYDIVYEGKEIAKERIC